MSLQAKHEKLQKEIASVSLDNFIEKLSSIEYLLQTSSTEPNKALVPQEPNFQLPNVFLKTKKLFKAENLFTDKSLIGNWNEQFDRIIKFIDNIKFDVEEKDLKIKNERNLIDEMIAWRNGKPKQ